MNGEPKQATSATTALIYITGGALIDVWSTVYYFYARRTGMGETTGLWISGFFFTGLVLVLIGLAVGRIGRASRPAEVAAVPSPVVAPAATPDIVEPVAGTTRAGMRSTSIEPVATAATTASPAAAPIEPLEEAAGVAAPGARTRTSVDARERAS